MEEFPKGGKMNKYFVYVQVSLLVLMFLHDWMPAGVQHKSNDFLKRLMGSFENGIMVLVPLLLTLKHSPNYPSWVRWAIIGIYGLLTLGTVTALLKKHIKALESFKLDEFIFKHNGHSTTDVFHILLYLQAWACFAMAWQL